MFLVASLTKPVVAMAALLLVERGQISLSDRVVDLIPEFETSSKRAITLRHLLTHTSGLPDMLPNNRALREANSPRSSFLEGTCAVMLDFAPGHGVQYQSMGFVLLGEIIRRVSGRPCGEFVRSEIFEPLEMSDSVLGVPDDWYEGTPPKMARMAGIQVPADQQQGTHWNWNSRYWQQLGAPWGGMISTPTDLAKFGLMMLTGARGRRWPAGGADHPAGNGQSTAGVS